MALVGTQMGQTLVAGRTDPVVAAAGIGSALALGGIVQTPGVSQFFGCTPLGPVGWGIALASASGATPASAVASPVLDRLGIWTSDADLAAA